MKTAHTNALYARKKQPAETQTVQKKNRGIKNENRGTKIFFVTIFAQANKTTL